MPTVLTSEWFYDFVWISILLPSIQYLSRFEFLWCVLVCNTVQKGLAFPWMFYPKCVCLTLHTWPRHRSPHPDIHVTEANVLSASLNACDGHRASDWSLTPSPLVSTFAHPARHQCSAAIKPMSSCTSWSSHAEIRGENLPLAFFLFPN